MKNNIEKHIQNSFDNFQPELDNDEIWANIEPRLKKKKKRRFLILWFLAGLGLLLGLFFKKKDKAIATTIQEETVRSTNEAPAMIEDEESNKALITEKGNKTTYANSKNKAKKQGKASKFKKEKQKKTNKKGLSKVTKNLANEVAKKANEAPNAADDKIEKTQANPLENKGGRDAEVQKITTQNLADIVLNSVDNKEEKAKKKKAKQPKQKKKKRKKGKWKVYSQIALAPVYALGGLSKKSTYNVGNVLLADRRETESYVDAFSGQYQLQFKSSKGFLIVGGLEYLQINEKYYTKEVDVQEEFILGTVGVVENALGQTIETIEGQKLRTTTKVVERKIYNNYHYFNVPFGIGGVWEKEQYDFKLFGGVQYHLYFHFDGTILNELANPIELTDRDTYSYESVFNKKMGLSLWLSGEYTRPINERLSWLIAPKIRLPVTSITNEEYPLAQRQYSFHLNLGVNYWLNP